MINHDWEALDKEHKFFYRKDKLELAKKHGYNYISEAVVKIYRELKSASKTAMMTDYTTAGVLAFLRKIGEPRAGRGGSRVGNKHKPQVIRTLQSGATSAGETRSNYNDFSEYQ